MYNEKDRDKSGFNPYVSPDFTIDEGKCIKYDDTGGIKAIVPVVPDNSERIKLDFQRVKKYVIVFVIFCILMECYYFATTFRVWKWQVKAWRPLIVNNLKTADMAEQAVIKKLMENHQIGGGFEEDEFVEKKRIQLRQMARKNDIILMTRDEIHELLGEPVPYSGEGSPYNDADMSYQEYVSFEYYEVSSNKYLEVMYCADICVGIYVLKV